MAKVWFSPLPAACAVPVVSYRCERGGSANIGTKRITSGRAGTEGNAVLRSGHLRGKQ